MDKEVCVVHIDTRRFFDEEQYSYLPEMNPIFGVYDTKEKAYKEVLDFFTERNKDLFELVDIHYDLDGEYIGSELIFKRVDNKYGGVALYGIDFYIETIE